MTSLLNTLRNLLAAHLGRKHGDCPLRFPSRSRQKLGWSRYICGLGR